LFWAEFAHQRAHFADLDDDPAELFQLSDLPATHPFPHELELDQHLISRAASLRVAPECGLPDDRKPSRYHRR
jgi:hypothetical protein